MNKNSKKISNSYVDKKHIIIHLCFIVLLIMFLCGGSNYIFSLLSTQYFPVASAHSPIAYQPQSNTINSINTKTISVKSIHNFHDYTLMVPSDWQVFRQEDKGINSVTLTSGEYQISINQAQNTPRLCTYQDSQGSVGKQFKRIFFVAYTPLGTIADGQLYRKSLPIQDSGTNLHIYEICQKIENNMYQTPTQVGEISYTTPANPSPSFVTEMDAIITSIK